MSSTLTKSFKVLEYVADIHNLEALAKATGLTKSTTYRIVNSLARLGYVEHVPREGYYLGRKLLSLGFKAYSQLHLPSIAHPYLVKLANLTQETVHLGILDEDDIVYIDKVDGNRGLQMRSRIGARVLPQSTSLGKILIAAKDDTVWSSYFDPNLRRTSNTIDKLEDFLNELKKVRSTGYSLDLEENETGIYCIGAEVKDASNQTVAALSLSVAKVYLTDKRFNELIPLVVDYGKQISFELGWKSEGLSQGEVR
ncbi:MAG TPA: IclR family transcriptional regulator [Firmicutes bacterium]|jgi:DNA-binding IclR family transcriptional regulator|nr:IclR family transcriptional regulator [Bacillota bacterium]